MKRAVSEALRVVVTLAVMAIAAVMAYDYLFADDPERSVDTCDVSPEECQPTYLEAPDIAPADLNDPPVVLPPVEERGHR